MRARGYVEGKNVALELHYCARQSAGAARGGVERPARQGRPCRVERTCDPRDGGGDGCSGPVCAERRPGGVGPRQEPRKTRRQFHRFDLPVARAGGEAGRTAEGNRFRACASLPCCRTPFIRESNRSGARPRKPHGNSASRCLYVPFAGAHELDKATGPGGRRAGGRVARLPGCAHDGAPGQDRPIRHRASAAFDVRMERVLRRRRADQLWREPARDLFLRLRPTPTGSCAAKSPPTFLSCSPPNSSWSSICGTADALGIDLDKSSILFRANQVIE